MKVGDLVQRKRDLGPWSQGMGIVLSKQISGSEGHLCLTVLYPRTGNVWDIAASLVKVVSACKEEHPVV